MRMKRWDYYGLTTPSHYFSFTVSDIGYLGMIFAYVVDFEKKRHHEETIAVPFAMGVYLPRNSTSGETRFKNKKVALSFKKENEQRIFNIHWKDFENGQDLKAEFTLQEPDQHESMNLVIPIEKKRFYFNRKINCMPANGWVEYLGTKHMLDPQSGLGNLDWGRGVWAYDSFWVWASASGFLEDGQTIGLNLGYGFGDTSQATENTVILNGKIHKLSQVDFQYNSNKFMEPWTMQSPDSRLLLSFTPFYERVARTDAKLLLSEVHQMFGSYNGTFITGEGETIQITNLNGFAEEHHARW